MGLPVHGGIAASHSLPSSDQSDHVGVNVCKEQCICSGCPQRPRRDIRRKKAEVYFKKGDSLTDNLCDVCWSDVFRLGCVMDEILLLIESGQGSSRRGVMAPKIDDPTRCGAYWTEDGVSATAQSDYLTANSIFLES